MHTKVKLYLLFIPIKFDDLGNFGRVLVCLPRLVVAFTFMFTKVDTFIAITIHEPIFHDNNSIVNVITIIGHQHVCDSSTQFLTNYQCFNDGFL